MFNEEEFKTIFETDEFVILENDSHYYINFKTENALINVDNIEDFPNCNIVNIAILKDEAAYDEAAYDFGCSECVHYQTESLEFNKYGDYVECSTGFCRALHDMSNTDAYSCPNFSRRYV